ncbi:MAG: cation-transporting P-type ATPase [Anaerolineales bacterium]|nr:cation-transporting P-type ATPase [Anaerolineales bacterium]
MRSAPVHELRTPEVFQSLETSPTGLTAGDAAARRSLYGDNLLSEAPRAGGTEKYLRLIWHPFTLLLFLAAILTAASGDFTLAIIILLLALVNNALSFWREHRAEQAIEKLRQLLPAYAHILRDGEECNLPASQVVPGDILILSEGDNVPADARVVEEYGLRVNNASLTGEALAARRTADASLHPGISEVERPNLIFAGTSIASGTGRAVVYATGMLTQFGRIAHLTQSVREEVTPFQRELERLGRVFSWIALGIGALVWVVSSYDPIVSGRIQQPLILALGIIVAVTPEGLPATLTLSLAMAVQRLAGQGVLAKRLNTVETLGNVSVLCTDKSGTLTQNQMTVRQVWVAGRRLRATGVGYEPKGNFEPAPAGQPFESDLSDLLTACLCCNNARLNPPSPGHPTWTSLGDQTEAALKVAALKFGLTEESINKDWPRIHELPFDARRKRMTTIHRIPSDGEMAFVKGSPREVLALCTSIRVEGRNVPLDEMRRGEILTAHDEYARRALRVLAIAQRELPARSGSYHHERVETDLTFLGLVAMMDPPRPEVEQAIRTCHLAGIRTVMITGDYGLTAESVARRVGMVTTHDPRIVTGAELDGMSDAALQQILAQEIIFARMAPDHKLRLVAAYQARGDVVAVTGDGVNDVPALRKSDIGIAMGLIGTDVAKEAADIILTDDNFGAIVSAIEEGRAIYDNIRKFISYIFSSNVPEVLPFLATALLGLPNALTVRQILAIDMGTDILPALALGMEKPEPGVMHASPRRRNRPLLDRGLLVRSFLWLGLIEAGLCFAAFVGTYLFSGNAAKLNLPLFNGLRLPHLLPFITSENVEGIARSVFHAGMVTAQVGNVFACRTVRAHNRQIGWVTNRFLWLGIAVELVLITGLIYVPFLARLFDQTPFPLGVWPILLLNAPILYALDWLRKTLARRASQPKKIANENEHLSEGGNRS